MEPKFISIAIASWLVALGAIVFMRLLNGSIRMEGLLRARSGGAISPERVQLFIASLMGAAAYAADALSKPPAVDGTLRDVPDMLLTLIAGSQFLYLGGKIMRLLNPGDNK